MSGPLIIGTFEKRAPGMSSNERTPSGSLAFPEFNRKPIRLSSFPKGLKSQTRAAMTKPEQNKYSESSISQTKSMRPYLLAWYKSEAHLLRVVPSQQHGEFKPNAKCRTRKYHESFPIHYCFIILAYFRMVQCHF